MKSLIIIAMASLSFQVYSQSDTVFINNEVRLDEVVVEQKRASMISKGLGNIQLDASRLRKTPLFLGERDVIKMLQFLPGVSSGMEGSSNLNIRGGANDQTLYLLDEIPVYNQNHTLGLLSVFNPDVLESATLYKGGVPARYGNRLSGVAAIKMKDGNCHEHHQSITAGPLMLAGSLEGPIVRNKLSYLLSARRSFLDLIMKGIISRRDNAEGVTNFAFYDVNTKISWMINTANVLSVQFYNGYDNLGMINKTADIDGKYSDASGIGWQTTMTSANLTSSLRKGLKLYSAVYYTHLNNFNFINQKYTFDNVNIGLKNRTFSDLQEFGLKSYLAHRTSVHNQLLYGIETTNQQFKPENSEKSQNGVKIRYNTAHAELNTICAFVSNELTVGQWQSSAELRASLYNNGAVSLIALEPRIRLTRLFGENNKAMIACDGATQPLHSLNEMNYSIQTDFWVPFMERNLPRSHQFSVGWKNYSFPGLTLTVETYLKKMRNLVRIDNIENYLDYHTDYETGSGRSMGFELMAQYEHRRLSAWLAYTLSKSTRRFEGVTSPFKYDMPHDVNAFLSYDVYKKGAYSNSLSLNAQYHTGIPYFIASSQYPSISMPSFSSGYYYDVSMVDYISKTPNTRLNDYIRADLNFTLEKRLTTGKGSRVWQFSLLNFTGHKNPYTVYRTPKGKYRAFLLISFMPSLSYSRYF